jgi:carbon monoxide dehydrogenase subunit G
VNQRTSKRCEEKFDSTSPDERLIIPRMSKQSIFLIIGLTALAGGCLSRDEVQGSGNVISEPRSVSGINVVELSGDTKLDIEQTGTESLTITADDNILPLLESVVRNGRLRLGVQTHFNNEAEQRIRYKLTVKDLSAIGLSGDGRIEAKNIAANRLKVSISGDGVIRAAGSAESQDISISGDGTYEAADLNSKSAEVHISGDGRATIAVAEKLSAAISGDGTVEYIGDPTVDKNISGDGSVRKK